MRIDTVHHLQRLLLDAVEEEAAWQPFLRALADASKAHLAMLFVHDYRSGLSPYATGWGIGSSLLEHYRRNLAPINPWVAEQARWRPGTVVTSHSLACDRALERTRFFSEFIGPLDARYAIGTNILKEDGQVVKLTALRSRRRGPMSERETNLFQALMPSLQSAMRLRAKLQRLKALGDANARANDAVATGVLHVDGNGTVQHMNRSAADILLQNDGLSLGPGKLLQVWNPQDARRLREAVALHVGCHSGTDTVMNVARPSGLRPYAIQVTRPPQATIEDRCGPLVAVYASDVERVLDDLERRIQAWFSLTAAEARLAACLANGRTLKTAAAHLGISESTARFVSTRIFSKTRTHGQAELVRLILASTAVVHGRAASAVSPTAVIEPPMFGILEPGTGG